MGLAIASLPLPSFAQIRSDGSLGTIVDRNGANYQIRGGTFVPGDLDNLFHSFERFDLNSGETATFDNLINGTGVDIIFARITDGNPSTINGTINGGDVNLFLMNPDGLVFNERASLQIGRSFFGVTADSISFFDNSRFTAAAASTETSGSVPRSFIFSGDNGDIVVTRNAPGGNAQIDVDVDRTFALIGGNVRISDIDQISAPSGRIEIIGVGSQPLLEAPLFVDSADNLGISFNFGEFPVGNGRVLIENSNIASEVDSSEIASNFFDGSSPSLNLQDNPDAGGIFIRASAQVLITDSNITAFTDSNANAGYVGLQTSPAGEIILKNGDVFATVEALNPNAPGATQGQTRQGGAVLIDTGDLTLRESSQVQVLVREGVTSPDTFAGTVYIQAPGTVSLEGSSDFNFPPAIFASVGSNAANASPTQANAGLILLDVGSLEVDASNGPALVESSNHGEGSAGVIIIAAENDVVVRGEGGLILSLAQDAPDNSSFEFQGQSPGFIVIGARRVGVLNGGEISANSQGTAQPGRIGIAADLIAMNRGVQLQSANGSIRNTGISAENRSGQGGLIVLDSGFLALANGTSVTTISDFDGNSNSPSNFQGINLDIDYEIIASPSLNNDIVVDARGLGGSAGTIEFEEGTQPFLRNIEIRDSSLSSNDISFKGEGGAADGALNGTFSEFSSFQPTAEPAPNTVDPSRLIAQGCGAGDLTAAQNIGDLTFTGRDGLAATPEEQLSSNVTSVNLASLGDADLAQADAWVTASGNSEPTSPVTATTIEAQTWRYGHGGQVVLAATAYSSSAAVFPGYTCNAL